jgi:hypothetical protein
LRQKQAQLTWHQRLTRLIVEGMSAIEVIEQIRALPEEERVKVVRFVIEHEESWIPTEFREAMDDAALGKMVDMERVMVGEKPPGIECPTATRPPTTDIIAGRGPHWRFHPPERGPRTNGNQATG